MAGEDHVFRDSVITQNALTSSASLSVTFNVPRSNSTESLRGVILARASRFRSWPFFSLKRVILIQNLNSVRIDQSYFDDGESIRQPILLAHTGRNPIR